jgi:hypothetical protein
LLRAEGFTDVRYVETASTDDYWQMMAAGKVVSVGRTFTGRTSARQTSAKRI